MGCLGRKGWTAGAVVAAVFGLGLVVAPGAAQAAGVDPSGPAPEPKIVMPPYNPNDPGSTTSSTNAGTLTYHGGAVQTGTPLVYIVYWGSQWGTPSVDGSGYTHLTGDAAGMAPAQQAFFKGLGTNGELWTAVNSQYCRGIASGSTSCPAGSTHVGYPTGGALAGVWVDNASAEPAAATQAQLAAEANAAAAHFGNLTAAANANVQYIITSATGLHPNNFNNPLQWCAWHSSTAMTIGSANGPLMYTNMPYLPDVGGSCGKNYVNGGAAGNLDGVSLVGGHEYAETVTDPRISAWKNPTTGDENADECAWNLGVSANVTLATGTFAVQSTWGNDANGTGGACQLSHPLVPNAPTAVSSTPGSGQVTVKWTAGSENAAPITAYQVRVTPNGSSPFIVNGTAATSLIVTGLTNGTSYTFEVAGKNSYGTGPYSTVSTAVAGAPTAPSLQTAAPGNATAKVSWWPASGNGSAVTAYVVTPYIGTTPQAAQTFNSTATTETVTGLTNGTTYTFTIAAKNARGTGPSSLPTPAITVGTPTAPTLQSAQPGNGTAKVSWWASTANASAITGYVITPYIGATAQTPQTFNSTATTQTISGLTNGTSYTFKIAGINAIGTGPQSAATNAAVVGAPTAPSLQSASPGNGTATVTWWPSTANASAITAYVITPYIGTTAQTPQTFNSTANTEIVTGLTNGTTYTFKIAAVNAIGTSPSSGATAAITVGAPAAPTGVTATAGTGQASVHWTAPAANASAITSYVVTPSIAGVAQAPQTFVSTATTQIVTGLTSGTTYTFKVAAINSTGTGPASAASAGVLIG